jgi:hypothetical protein|tara:strand:- start:54 stop:239 length:186 start_codon:yes stop_codon:yes gene_type:complete
MDNREFDQHDCPFSIDPADGESWEDFKSRADQWREYIRLIAKEEGRAMTEVALEMRPSLRG